MGQGKFPVRTTTDEEGNRWFRQDAREERINKGVRGAHTSIPFQCEDCWFLNIEGRPRISGLDDVYAMCIRRANLDAMCGRAVSTIEGHAAATKRAV